MARGISLEDSRTTAEFTSTSGDIESVLVLHYGRLVRLAYAVLPAGADRHRRVLAAHAVVQGVLPVAPRGLRFRTRGGGASGSRSGGGRRELTNRGLATRGTKNRGLTTRSVPTRGRSARDVPTPRGSGDLADHETFDLAFEEVRQKVLTSALRARPLRRVSSLSLSLVPRVWGLRLVPYSGGTEELELERALAELSREERAAYALLTLESLSPADAEDLLEDAGADDTESAVRAARRLLAEHPREALRSPQFDPCSVHTRPTDLLLRRTRLRVVAAGGLALLAVMILMAAFVLQGGPQKPAITGASTSAADPGRAHGAPLTVASLVRVPATAWRTTARIDFTAWPARGPGVGDETLLASALAAWTDPAEAGGVRVGAGTGAATALTVPAAAPRLLWAGHLDAASVVLFSDGVRLARYTRPDAPSVVDPVRLDLVRADDSDVTSAGAVLLRSTSAGDRFLIAPWVDSVELRDLHAPDTPARGVAVADGLTPLLPAPSATGCGSQPTLQLRSSNVIAEHHAFLLTDLGDVTVTHLTYTPPPKSGVAAQSPREATGPDALQAWSRLVCTLPALRGQDVKQINDWEFARQALPENQGSASWDCTRADHWDGTGSAATEFAAPAPAGTAAVVTASQASGRACSRFEQYVMASTWWKSPAGGRQYLLAAGSRTVARISVSGAGAASTSAATPDHTLAVQTANRPGVIVAGVLDSGSTIRQLSG